MNRTPQKGQAILLIVTATGILLAGGMGLAIDSSQLYFQRQMAQAAADAAAVSGAMSMFQGTNVNTNPGYFDTSTTFACGVSSTKIPCKYASYHGFGTTASDTITVSFPTDAVGYSGSLSTSDSPNQIQVKIARAVPNTFIRLVGGPATSTAGAVARAAIVSITSPVPMILTHPTDPNVLTGNGNTKLIICGGPSRSIQVNSSNTNAFSGMSIDLSHAGPADPGDCSAGTGADMGVFGGKAAKPSGVSLGTTGKYLQPASPIQDPLAFVNAPAVPANHTGPVTISNGTRGCHYSTCQEYSPGLYTKIDIKNDNAIFDPGVYYIQGGGFTLKNSSANMCAGCASDANAGQGMLVYDTGTVAQPHNTGGFQIQTGVSDTKLVGAGMTVTTPPATPVAPVGPYYGILFFEDRNADKLDHGLGQGNGCFNLMGHIYITNTLAIMQADANHYQSISYNGNPCSGTKNQGMILTGKFSIVGTTDVTMNLFPQGFLKVRQVTLVQ